MTIDDGGRPELRVAVAQDWMLTYGGSERVVRELRAAFPGGPLLTSVLRPEMLPTELRDAVPSFLQRVPPIRRHHEWALPLMPAAWRLRPPVADVDAVISSSHACAKAVRVRDRIPHLCYCHTPMRYAWDFDSEKERFPRATRPFAQAAMVGFRRWDRRNSARVTRFVANSSAVAARIDRFYGRAAEVVHPPVDTEFFTPDGAQRTDEFLYVGRLVSYKRADLVVEAFAELPYKLLVVGDGHLGRRLRERATSNVEFLGNVGNDQLRTLYRRTRAMIYPAVEDFGIAMAEAQACGAPVVSVDEGGALDIVQHGRTGLLTRPDDVVGLRRMVRRAAGDEFDSAAMRVRSAAFSASSFRTHIREIVVDLVEDPTAR